MRNTAGTEARHNFQKYLHQHFVMTVGDGRAQAFLLAHGVANEAMCTTLPLRFSFEVLGAGCVSLALRALRFRPQSPPPLSVPRKAAARPASLGCCGLAAHVPRSRESHAGPRTQGLGRRRQVGHGGRGHVGGAADRAAGRCARPRRRLHLPARPCPPAATV